MNATYVHSDFGRGHRGLPDAKPSLWERFRRAAAGARLNRSERDIARFLQENGGRLTDDIERRILDRTVGLERGGFC